MAANKRTSNYVIQMIWYLFIIELRPHLRFWVGRAIAL